MGEGPGAEGGCEAGGRGRVLTRTRAIRQERAAACTQRSVNEDTALGWAVGGQLPGPAARTRALVRQGSYHCRQVGRGCSGPGHLHFLSEPWLRTLWSTPILTLKVQLAFWTSFLFGTPCKRKSGWTRGDAGLLPTSSPHPASPSLIQWSSCHRLEWISGCMSQNGGRGCIL